MTVNYQQRYSQEAVKTKTADRLLVRRLLAYLYPYRFWVWLAILLLVGARIIDTIVPIQVGRLTQTILSTPSVSQADQQTLYHSVLHSILLIVGWAVFGYFLDILNIVIKNWVGQKALFNLRTQVYEHMQKLPVSFFDHHPIGRLMTRTIHDVDQISQLFSESVIPIIGSIVLFISIFVAIFFLDWELGIATCFILPLTWWFTNRFRYYQRRCYDAIRSILSAMNSFVQEYLMGVSIIRNFGLHQQERKKFDELNRDHFESNMESVHHFSLFFAGIDTLQNLSLIIIFVLLVVFARPNETFQAGTYFTFSIYVLMIFRPLLDLAERYNILQSAMAAAERIFEVLDTPVENAGPQPGLPLHKIQSVAFEDVWFAYEEENWILRGLSLTFKQGESVALIGMTGSGKTSVLNLLLRFYECQKGRILINGEDIRHYAVSSLRRQFSMILQDPVIFAGTISDNIALYDPSIDLPQIEAAVDFVNLRSTIDRLPGKLQSELTERGGSLSVGEMQLISLARAVAHQRSLLIFDEATANIDIQTEKIIQAALKRIFAKKTALIIAHRLSTIRDANRICVLHQGKIVESGTHDQLILHQGIYEKLYRLQFVNPINEKIEK